MGQEIPQGPDARVAEVAQRQHGSVTYAQLSAAGLNALSVRHRVKQGRLFPVYQGVYAVGRPPHLPLERASAAVLACGPGAALSHLGALAAWGFTGVWPWTFEVVVAAGVDRRPKGVRTHRYRGLTDDDVKVQLGIAVTSPARTILDCLPRLADDSARRRIVNDALHDGRFLKRDALVDVRARFRQHPGARLLDPILDQPGITLSPMEDDFLAFCRRHRLPLPQVNVWVRGKLVDALWPAHQLIVELDSWEFHGDRQAFEDDRERDAENLRHGLGTIRSTWERLHARAEAEAERIRDILNQRQGPST